MVESKISKGVGEVGHAVMVIVFFALVLGSILGIAIFQNIDASGTVNNETLSAIDNVTNATFSIITTYPTAVCTLTSLINTTGGETVAAGNYTFYDDGCNIILEDDSEYIGEDVNSTYTYTATTSNTLAGINVDALSAIFAAFVVAVTAFVVIGGTLLGILWILPYIRPLFKKDALGMSD